MSGFAETIAWYDEHAEEYAEAGAGHNDFNHIHSFAALLPTSGKVLDMGCGPGRHADLLAKEGLQVTGLDFSEGLLSVARKRFPLLEFVQGDFLSLPFENGSFDGVWANTSLLHLETIEEVQTALGEAYRVLKSRGVIHILVKAQVGAEKTAVVGDRLSGGHERFFQYFQVEEMKELLEVAGFSLHSIKQYNETETIPNGRPEVELIWALATR